MWCLAALPILTSGRLSCHHGLHLGIKGAVGVALPALRRASRGTMLTAPHCLVICGWVSEQGWDRQAGNDTGHVCLMRRPTDLHTCMNDSQSAKSTSVSSHSQVNTQGSVVYTREAAGPAARGTKAQAGAARAASRRRAAGRTMMINAFLLAMPLLAWDLGLGMRELTDWLVDRSG